MSSPPTLPRLLALLSPPVAAPAAAQYAPELPADVLRVVLTPLANDVASLCAAACVARAWRAAACDPRLWRRLRFPPKAARQLTDAALAALVRRVGGELERVNLEGCVRVTARGAAEALAGKKLQALAVRGLRTGGSARGGGDALPLLSGLVRRDTGLDVHGGRAALLCCAPLAAAGKATKPCARLCGAADTLCDACGIVRCARCTQAAKAARVPPCDHLCDRCFGACDESDLVDCDACGRQRNGFCDDCTCVCDACASCTFCADCAFAGGALVRCDGAGCDELFCESCAFDTLHLLTTCAAATCGKVFCESCAFEAAEMRSCDACGATFCDGPCADARLSWDEDGDEELCAACEVSGWDIATDKEDEEEEEEDDRDDEVLDEQVTALAMLIWPHGLWNAAAVAEAM
jgi:hypothetical protein